MGKQRGILVIRDDDVSFFTKPSELEKAYSFLGRKPVSFSVVFSTVPIHKDSVFPYGANIEYRQYNIMENVELIDYLKEKKQRREVDILLHGFSHEYKFSNNRWEAEMIWKDYSQAYSELFLASQTLKKCFGNDSCNVFVPPNNLISPSSVKVVEKLNMNISGQIRFFDRPFSFLMIINSIKRNLFRLFHGFPYGGFMRYERHIEAISYPLDNFDKLVKEYNHCKRIGAPFMIYTHYWDLLKNTKQKELLERIVSFVIDEGGDLKLMSECFDEYERRKK